MFFRKITTRKNGKEYVYVKLIENYRTNGKIKQRVVANFGSLENLSPHRITDLITSLRRLYQEIEVLQDKKLVVEDLIDQASEISKEIRNRKVLEPFGQVFQDEQYQILEALIIKSLVASEMNSPVEEICQQLGLVNADSIQFYNIVKMLGEDSTRPQVIKARLSDALENEKVNKVIYIYPLKSTFKGRTFRLDPTGNPYSSENYQKEFLLWLAYDQQGVPLDFTWLDKKEQLAEQLNHLVQRLETLSGSQVIVMDREGVLTGAEVPYPIAWLTKQMPRGEGGTSTEDQDHIFQATQVQPESELKIKEMKANLAKVAAGMENIKADILLGKLSKESAIKKRAEAVIRTNNCQDMVTCFFNDTNQTLHYYIKDTIVEQKSTSLVTTSWVVPKGKLKHNITIPNITIKADQFQIITDQLNIPPINLYADYHYSREVISGHIVLEIIKKQIAMVTELPQQGGDTPE